MKQKVIDKFKILLIILALTILISIPYLNFKDIFAHDISYHTNRIIAISEELRAGHFPVLIHSNLLDGFGYANSLFYPELFLYIPAVLLLCGMNFLNAYKVLIILSTFFTFLVTFWSANRISKNKNIAWITTILYGCAFYRLTDVYIRGAIGEVLAFVFLPLVISGLYEIIYGENKKWWIICFGIFGLINSHILSFAMIAILIIIICLINIKRIFEDKKRLINLVIAGTISILLICSFIFPYLEQTHNNKFNVDEKIYNGEFLQSYSVSLDEMIISEFYKDEFYKGIGILLLILPIFIIKCKNKNEENRYMKQLFILGIFSLFISSNIFPWKNICEKYNFVTTIQFPYRFNMLTTVLFSFVGGYSICNLLNNKEEIMNFLYVFLIICILSSISLLDVNAMNFTQEKILKYAPVGNGEYKPYGLKQTDKDVHNIRNNQKIEFTRNSSKLEFEYKNELDEMIIHIPLTYYEGYIAYIEKDGEKKELEVSKDEDSKNLIISSDEILTGKITIEYKMTILQKVGYGLTYITLVVLVTYIMYYYIKEYKINKNS